MVPIRVWTAVCCTLTLTSAIGHTVVQFAGTSPYSGDGGPATTATLARPHGVTIDSRLVEYIADSSNNAIRKVAGGVITTLAGTGAAGYSGEGGPAR